MGKYDDLNIPLGLLPKNIQEVIGLLVNRYRENGAENVLSIADFRKTQEIIDDENTWPARSQTLCMEYSDLKRLLNVPGGVGSKVPCNIMPTAEDVLRTLRDSYLTIEKKTTSSNTERLALLEYAGKILWTYYQRNKKTDPTNTGNRLFMENKDGFLQITAYIKDKDKVYTANVTVDLSLDESIKNLKVKIDGKEISPEQSIDIIYTMVQYIGTFWHAQCHWPLLNTGSIPSGKLGKVYLGILANVLSANPELHSKTSDGKVTIYREWRPGKVSDKPTCYSPLKDFEIECSQPLQCTDSDPISGGLFIFKK